MGRGLLRNPGVRAAAAGFLAVTLAVSAAAAVSAVSWARAFSRAIAARDAALMGRLLSAYPEKQEEIVSAFTRGIPPEEATAGAESAARFGFRADLPPLANPLLRPPLAAGAALAAAMIVLAAAGYALVLRGSLSRVYREIRAAADGVEAVVQGDGAPRLPEKGEGEVSFLGSRVNELAGRLYAAVEQLKREKNFLKDFLADVSHQLKTPLSSVKMFSELLQDEGLDGARREDFLAKSRQQIERMEWLIASLLSCARLEADAVELCISPAALELTVEDALEGLRPAWEKKGVTLAWEKPAASVMVPHDRRWIAEALSNIVKNAVEHTPEGGRVSVELQDDPVLARVTVTDSGTGIALTDLPAIFARFFRSPASGRGEDGGPRPVSGTGIGLALAKAIVERHGGVVSVSSVPGAGTKLSVTLHKIDI